MAKELSPVELRVELRPGTRDYAIGHEEATLVSAALVTKTHGTMPLNPSVLREHGGIVCGVPERVQFLRGVLSVFPVPTFPLRCVVRLQFLGIDRRRLLIDSLKRQRAAIAAAELKRVLASY